ncbi:MAG: two-component system response regulator [Deltaproteobacteria bacterium]|nr:two-component system response regulator [Deltaproteobacteria bacterium]
MNKIMIVDDEPINITMMQGVLGSGYEFFTASQGREALELLQNGELPDLIVLDVIMPDMDGYEVCGELKKDPRTKDIPVIFVTGLGDIGNEKTGIELGAVDYIAKPISPEITRARIRNHLELKQARDLLQDQNLLLENRVRERTSELETTKDVTILTLASLAETRDNETGNHIMRTKNYVRVLAENLAFNPKYSDVLTEGYVQQLHKSAPLHDIGKVGIPDAILLKPGKLTPEEFDVIKRHTVYGRDALYSAEMHLGTTSFLSTAKEIAYSHHEKWDGTGYPEGLAGEDIPLSARIMAVADVYDALIAKRVYKEPFSHEKAMEIIIEGDGRHFDPDVVRAFIEVAEDFRQIAKDFAD